MDKEITSKNRDEAIKHKFNTPPGRFFIFSIVSIPVNAGFP